MKAVIRGLLTNITSNEIYFPIFAVAFKLKVNKSNFLQAQFLSKLATFTNAETELNVFMTVMIIMEHKINLAREDKYLGILCSDKLTLECSLTEWQTKFDFSSYT